MKNHRYLVQFVALSLLLLASCNKQASSPDSPPSAKPPEKVVEKSHEGAVTNESGNQVTERHEYLELIVQNNTRADIDEVAVVLRQNPCTFGIVGTGVSKGYLGWQRPVGTNALVQWRDSSKTKREAQAELSTVYLPEVPGQLTFTISGTNMTVDFKRLNRKR